MLHETGHATGKYLHSSKFWANFYGYKHGASSEELNKIVYDNCMKDRRYIPKPHVAK